MKRRIALSAPIVLASILLASEFSLCVSPVLAEDCGTLTRLTSVDLIPAPRGVNMIPVTINGVPQKLLLDTAGGISTISRRAVAALGLHPLEPRGTRKLLDRGGNVSRAIVNLENFTLGTMQGKDIEFMVSPNPASGTNPNLPIDGVLAGDLMERYDVEMDFAAGKVNYFSPDHCDGHVVYWPNNAVAVVPFRTQRPGTIGNNDTHIRVPVKLDGKPFLAVINTGEPRSTMSAATAKDAFGVTADSPGAVPLGTFDGDPDHKVFGHIFGSLGFEGITIANPHIAILPDLIGSKDPDNNYRTGSNIMRVDDNIGPEVTIGMDVLKKLHLYIAYHERNLYITSAAPTGDAPAP